MESVKKRKRIPRIFSKKELKKICDRLEAGDATALPIWCSYFEVMAAISAGKAVNGSRRNHEDQFHELYHDGWLAAQSVGAEVLSGKLKLRQPENYTWKAIKNAIEKVDKDDREWLQDNKTVDFKSPKYAKLEAVDPNRAKELWEDLMACCEDDFQRKVLETLAGNGGDHKQAAELLDCAVYELQHARAQVGKLYIKRLKERDERLNWLEKRVAKLGRVRKPSPKQSKPKQSKVWPADKPAKGRPVKV